MTRITKKLRQNHASALQDLNQSNWKLSQAEEKLAKISELL